MSKIRDWFYTLRKGRKARTTERVKEIWTDRGADYMGHQERLLSSAMANGDYFAQDALFRHINCISFSSILELGCGYGFNIKRLLAEFPDDSTKIFGIDFSPTQLRNLKSYVGPYSNGRVQITEGDIAHMSLADKSVDTSFSLGVLMNVPPADIDQALKEIARVTRNEIILIEYYRPNVESKRIKQAFDRHPFVYSHDYEKKMNRLGHSMICYDENRGSASDRYTFYEFVN